MDLRTTPVELKNYLKMGVYNYRGKILVQTSFWCAAIGVGVFAVYFFRLIDRIQEYHAHLFMLHPWIMLASEPFCFLAGIAVVRFFAPHAGGSGIPQALYSASEIRSHHDVVKKSGMVSFRVAFIKIISCAFGFLGGASIGGEGPTVQISVSIFHEIGRWFKKFYPEIDLQSYLVAGAGAGIAAAFNSPLGGIAFALEEVAAAGMAEFKYVVMLGVIIAGLTTQTMRGDLLYYPNPFVGPEVTSYIYWAIVIGIAGGLAGVLFASLVSSQRIYKWDIAWWKKALLFGFIVAVLEALFAGATAGSGDQVTRSMLANGVESLPIFYPLAKLFATALSTMSGLGGGILSPSLTTGAWLGASVGKLVAFHNLKMCALLGMVAYLSGTFQIPLTSVLIVAETTNEHAVILPMMIAAVSAFAISKALMPVSLYHRLMTRFSEPRSEHHHDHQHEPHHQAQH